MKKNNSQINLTLGIAYENHKKGNLKLVNYDGKVYHFGDLESSLVCDIKINKSKLPLKNKKCTVNL